MNKQVERIEDTFGSIKSHKHIGEIIQQYSTNPSSIDSVAYSSLSFDRKIRIADVGCGYGRSVEHIAEIAPKSSEYIGIDLLQNNGRSFLDLTDQYGFNGKFICGKSDKIADFPDDYFDLIICNYSLYFFIESLPQIIRKLHQDGIFITITHSHHSLNELLFDLQEVLDLDHTPSWNELGSEQILDNFSSENGFNILKRYFNDIDIIEYKNNLKFHKDDIHNLFELLNFKKSTLIHHNKFEEYIKTIEFDNHLGKVINQKIEETGKYILNKDDVIYRCQNKNVHE